MLQKINNVRTKLPTKTETLKHYFSCYWLYVRLGRGFEAAKVRMVIQSIARYEPKITLSKNVYYGTHTNCGWFQQQ